MQAGALNKHLQPETADLVHRQEAEQEAENRRLGVSDEGKPISGKPDMLDNAAGPQPEPEVELGGATMKTKIPDVLLVPEGLKDAGVSAPGTKKAASVQLHLYHFQVRFLPAICTLPPFTLLPPSKEYLELMHPRKHVLQSIGYAPGWHRSIALL